MSTEPQKSEHKAVDEPTGKGLWAIVFTVFLDLVGIGLIIPVVAPMLLDPNATAIDHAVPEATRNIILGALLTCYPLGVFFGAPILGAIADSKGRKKVLMAAIFAAGLSYLLFALGVEQGWLWLLFASRLLAGLMGGNISIAYSIISDIVPPAGRTRAFGLLGASFGIGFIIGPFLGGKLSDPGLVPWFGYDTPFLAAAALSLVNVALVYFNLPETLKHPKKAKLSFLTGVQNIQKAFQNDHLKTIFTVAFLTSMGFAFFSQFFQVYVIHKFHFNTPRDANAFIGNMFAAIGVNGVIVQAGLLRLLKKGTPPVKVLRFSLPGVAISFLMLLIPEGNPYYLLAFLPLVSISIGFTNPNISTAVSTLALPNELGEVFGIQQSLSALGLALPPFIAGFLTTLDIHLPILVASFFCLMAWLVLLLRFREEKRRARAAASPLMPGA